MNKLRGRLTYANIMATIAVFIALGGASYAAFQLPKNSVGAQQIKRNGVKAPEIAENAARKSEIGNNSVGTEEVANGTLLGEDFAPGQIPAGPPGQGATNLFASIRDPEASEAANVQYGRGVVSVNDPLGNNQYEITFDRSVTNCIVQVTPGRGDPPGPPALGFEAVPVVDMFEGTPPETVKVLFESNVSGTIADDSFFISAVC
jgi:hypothetical protein